MNIEQEIKRIMEDRSHPAIEQAEWAKTYLVEHFVTHANLEAFKASGYDNNWVQDLIDEPSHSWAIEWVADELAQLECQ